MISAANLHKRYGDTTVLQGLSLEAQPGKVTLLVGPNGAGKTTTLRILAGLSRPDSGEVKIAGVDLVKRRIEAQRNISFLPQGVAFHPRLNSRRLLKFYAQLRGCSLDRVPELLSLAGLEAHARKPAAALSGGLRQRLGLALLLLPQAPVLLLDEPGLSLDPEWRERLHGLLQLEARAGRTVLVATHLLAEWEGRADECLLCCDGRVTGSIDPARLRDAFQSDNPQMRVVA